MGLRVVYRASQQHQSIRYSDSTAETVALLGDVGEHGIIIALSSGTRWVPTVVYFLQQ